MTLPGSEEKSPGGPFRCANCGRWGDRGLLHSCPARGLIELTPATRQVLDACAHAGGHPLIVGGSVRDAMLARLDGHRAVTPKDVDIEVYDTDADALSRALSAVGRVDEVGRSFGVLKVKVGHGQAAEDFDVALPRADSKTGAGHRGFDVRVDNDLDEVAAFGRRDYTINAMGWDPVHQDLVDPYGGSVDLDAGILRHTTGAFSEDPLRVLRGVQFAGRFDMEFAPETAELCRELAPTFSQLPPERIWGEFAKIATLARRPSRSLQALHDAGWEQHFPELAAVRDVPQDPQWHPEGPVHVHLGMAADVAARAAEKDSLSDEDRTVVVLGAMVHDLGKATHTDLGDQRYPNGPGNRITSHGHAEAGVDPARSFLQRIGAPGRFADKVVPIVREHMAVASTGRGSPSPAAVRRLIRRLDDDGRGPGLKLWAAVVAADHAGRGTGSGPSPADGWLRVAERLGSADRPLKGLLTGRHLIAAGMTPGPAFKPILTEALSAQDDGLFDDEAGAIAWLRKRGTA